MVNRLDLYVQKQLDLFNDLPSKVKTEIERSLMYKKSGLTGFVSRCDSPIEQLLGVHLMEVEQHLYMELPTLKNFKSLHTIPQKEIETDGGKYRLDFLIECAMHDKTYNFAIECDGHNFHEKTKEQAAKDKSRERSLMKEGIIMMRFTGSEIWKDPSKCAAEVIKIISKTVGLDDYIQKLIDEMYISN
ncbi:endonuclease domain-containing protein [Oceanobacillus locisalsi]|uniref:Endonuclease domain-containing protein n=1 Tax=Oceanobacillus locisalsi TaxID=546107 RepID=A0ABW3NG44_9BACI